MTGLTEGELAQIQRANADDRTPVVFVHGLWLLASSWDGWRTLFEERGYVAVAPGWPDDPDTVETARNRPEVFAGKSIATVTDHYVTAIKALNRTPVLVGHSFGGLFTQKLAGMGLAKASVAIDPAPFRGVLPLPISALKAAFPVLGNPVNRKRSVMLTFPQFRFAFGNAVPEQEARALYDKYAVPGSGAPLFQAAAANLNPRTEAAVDTRTARRGPLLIISGERDNTVPWAIANASFRGQQRNPGVTAITEMSGRGHSLVIDSGWPEVADTALTFLDKHV